MFILTEKLKTKSGGYTTKQTVIGSSFMIIEPEHGEDFNKYENHKDFQEGMTYAVVCYDKGVYMLNMQSQYAMYVLEEGTEIELTHPERQEDNCQGCDCEDSCEADDELEALEELLTKQSGFVDMISSLANQIKNQEHFTCGGVKCGQKDCLGCKGSNNHTEKEKNILESLLRGRGY